MAGEVYTLEGLAVPEELDRLHELLERVAAEHPALDAGEVMMLETAVMEIAGNVIEHGRPPGTVRWHFAVDVGEHLVATLRDSGEEHSADLTREMPEVLAEDGRGLPLAGMLLDELHYSREDGANVWTMVRHHDGRAQ